MVNATSLKVSDHPQVLDPAVVPAEELRFCSVTLNEVLARGSRLEASVFDVEGKHAREVLGRCKWEVLPLFGPSGFVAGASYPGRFKRGYCSPNSVDPIGFLGSSEMLDIKPEPVKFISRFSKQAKEVSVEYHTVLLSRSGTIGNVTFVSKTLSEYLVSEHAIRITSDYPGYVYSFLRTAVGLALVQSSIYGAVVDQIEPEHLGSVPIPSIPPLLKKRIHDLVIQSYDLRDESNALLHDAERLLYDALKLPPLSKLRPHAFAKDSNLRNYTVNVSRIAGRLDASYHVPVIAAIMRRLKEKASEIITIGDPRISKRIILPGRFARVYVEEGQGVPFFGGKQIHELDPANKKYLSLVKHGDRVSNDLKLTPNMTLITRSGTIGKVALVPEHWSNWIINEHVIRVEPSNQDIAGYLYVFLATEYGRQLITRFTYGSVVDEIDDSHVGKVSVPLLKDSSIQAEINRLALEANAKRTQAYQAEQRAIRITNKEVVYADGT